MLNWQAWLDVSEWLLDVSEWLLDVLKWLLDVLKWLHLEVLVLLVVVCQVTWVARVVHVWSTWAPRHVGIRARLTLCFLDEKRLLAGKLRCPLSVVRPDVVGRFVGTCHF